MGWCSATGIFDAVLDELTAQEVEPEVLTGVAETLYDVLTSQDWDCESDSRYFNTLLIEIMYSRGDLDDEDYDYYKKNPLNN